MKYIKTYEGLFSKEEPKVPQSFIDKVVKTIKDGGYPNTKVVDSSPVVNRSDRTTIIKSQTSIGNMLTVIQLIFDKYQSIPSAFDKVYHKAIKGIEKYYSINISVFPEDRQLSSLNYNRRTLMIGGTRYYNVKLKDINRIQLSLIPTTINQLIDQIQKSNVKKKELDDFYTDFTQEELIDLVSDLSDILDSSPDVAKSNAYGKGYKVSFNTAIQSSRYEDKERRFRASDMMTQAIVELNSLDKRLRDGYGLEMEFSIHNKSIVIEVWKEEKKVDMIDTGALPIPEPPQNIIRF